MQFAALRKRVVEAHHALVDAGLVVLTFGNASEVDRDKEVIAIKPSGVPYDQLVPEAIVIVDLHTGAVANGGYRPSSDTPTHRVLYRKFAAIGAVVHTHSAAATAWSQARRDLPCFGTTHADHFFGPVPTTRALNRDEVQHQYEERTGDVIVETLEVRGLDPVDMPAVLVASHGPFTWGNELEHAVQNAIALETVASLALRTLVLEPAAAVVEGPLLERHFLRKHGSGAYYGQRR